MCNIIKILLAAMLIITCLDAQGGTVCLGCNKTDGFPAIISDAANNQIGYTYHTLVCSIGATQCTVTGNITFDAYVQGNSNLACVTNSWSCQGSTENTDSYTRDDRATNPYIFLVNCTASTSQSNTHTYSWNCSIYPNPGNPASFDCIIKDGLACQLAQITVTFSCQ